ncbi:unnamed protein product [Staurois parvus]|uniref:Uncharacterized protein n=1 Tax=Staurois parvus TaxID=386267 RepID=A0ABN9HI75_9NEOB|nr:unnamed protein product [Staurois parvus]
MKSGDDLDVMDVTDDDRSGRKSRILGGVSSTAPANELFRKKKGTIKCNFSSERNVCLKRLAPVDDSRKFTSKRGWFMWIYLFNQWTFCLKGLGTVSSGRHICS